MWQLSERVLSLLQVSDAQALIHALGARAASEVLGVDGLPAGPQDRPQTNRPGFGPAHALLPPPRLGTFCFLTNHLSEIVAVLLPAVSSSLPATTTTTTQPMLVHLILRVRLCATHAI